MADRYDLPKIKPEEKPTLLNGEAGNWGMAGSLVGFIGGGIAQKLTGNTVLGSSVIWGTTALGTAFGALKGKARMEREAVEGKTVKNPTLLNRGFFTGAFVGWLVSVPVFFLARGNLKLAGALSTGIQGIGMVAGMVMRKNSMQRDFDKATQLQQAKQDVSLSQARVQEMEPAVSYKNSVSKDEAAALAQKQERTEPKAGAIREEQLAEAPVAGRA